MFDIRRRDRVLKRREMTSPDVTENKKSDEYTVRNVDWREDCQGVFWIAELYRNGERIGLTGSYYDIDEETDRRPSREDQVVANPEYLGIR